MNEKLNRIGNLQSQIAVYRVVHEKVQELKTYCENELSTVLHEGAVWEEIINKFKCGCSLEEIQAYCEQQQKHLVEEITKKTDNEY